MLILCLFAIRLMNRKWLNSPELKARQHHRATNQNRCDAHEDYHKPTSLHIIHQRTTTPFRRHPAVDQDGSTKDTGKERRTQKKNSWKLREKEKRKSGHRECVCVLHIKPFFLDVDIQHNQRPCRFFNPINGRDTSFVATPCFLFFFFDSRLNFLLLYTRTRHWGICLLFSAPVLLITVTLLRPLFRQPF